MRDAESLTRCLVRLSVEITCTNFPLSSPAGGGGASRMKSRISGTHFPRRALASQSPHSGSLAKRMFFVK
jgi:hypothetical protein